MLVDENQVRWRQFISGDDNSYSWMYTTYSKKLYQYGLCFTSDKELVKDCIQDLFTYIYRCRVRLSTPGNIKVYLFAAFRNNLVKAIHKANIMENLADDMPFLIEMTVEERFIQNEHRTDEIRKVKKALSLLTSRQREIIYYRFIQEMSMEEICTIMDLNYQSAQNLIQRSLKKVRNSWGDVGLFVTLLSLFS